VTSLQLHDSGSSLFGAMLQRRQASTHLVISGNIIFDRARNIKVDLPLLLSLYVRAPHCLSDQFAYFVNMISAPLLETLLFKQTTAGEINGLTRLASGAPKFSLLRSLTLLAYGGFDIYVASIIPNVHHTYFFNIAAQAEPLYLRHIHILFFAKLRYAQDQRLI
jgi:hypothetical protein